jgi:hypothetical protein
MKLYCPYNDATEHARKQKIKRRRNAPGDVIADSEGFEIYEGLAGTEVGRFGDSPPHGTWLFQN